MTEGLPLNVYLDSNVFIYCLEGDADVAGPLQRMFSEMRSRVGVFVTSELTLAEVLAPSKKYGPVATQLKRRYLDLIVWNPSVQLHPVSRDVLYETADLRRRTGQKLPDAIHSVTAVRARCAFLLSGDHGMNRLPDGMAFVETDSRSVNGLIESIHG